MQLTPTGPPQGHRRARRYAAEMLELHRQGYTFEAIREALAGIGVRISNSTVQREIARHVGLAQSSAGAGDVDCDRGS